MMAELLENESEVSDVDPEELANLIKGVDDMDDELFGFSSKSNQEVQKPKAEIKVNDEKGVKSKSTFEDPLADISLSDDDFYGVTGSVTKKLDGPKAEVKISDVTKTSPLKTNRAKKIADLFGLDDNAEDGPKEEKSYSASDWLGIKESPEKKKPDDHLKTDNKNVQEVFPKVEGSNNIIDKKSIVFDLSGDSEEFQMRRRKSSAERVKFQNVEMKENEHDVFGLLEDKGSESKPRKLLDEPFAAIGRGRTGRRSSDENKRKEENTSLLGKTSEQSGIGQYTPSLGASRRPGLPRKRDTSPLSNTNTPPTSLKITENDWLTSVTPQESSKQSLDKRPAKQESSSAKDVTADKLPPWLGGSNFAPLQREVLQDTGQKVLTETSQGPVEIKQPSESLTPEAVLMASNLQSRQTALALQKTETQLLAALQLKQQQESMNAVCHRQVQLLEVQEKQLNSLVEQHLRRQAEVEIKMQAQQERIGALLETLMTSNPHPSLPAEITKNIPESSAIAEIEADLNKFKAENQDLKMKIEFLEKIHQNELAALRQAHQRDSQLWHEQEDRFRSYNKQLHEDYEARIHQLKESAAEQLRLEKERIDRLQEERMSDLKQLGEFHRAVFEQISVINMIPARSTAVTIQRPSDETQLTARESSLIQKELELAALQEKLSTQKEVLEKRTEELEEKMEFERMKNEELARQLKREKRELNTKEQIWLKEQEQLREQHDNQMKYIEELRENVLKLQTRSVEERLQLAEERAHLEALSNLQGLSRCASFDILQARAEVHGALEATKAVEMELGEERQRLRELQRSLDLERWKLQEYERDIAARAEHLDFVLQEAQASKEEGLKALEQAKQIKQKVEGRNAEVEERMKTVLEMEQKLMKNKMEFTQEEIRLNKRREQLEHILPELSATESLSLQPVSKSVIDPKKLIMKLKAEKEMDSFCR